MDAQDMVRRAGEGARRFFTLGKRGLPVTLVCAGIALGAARARAVTFAPSGLNGGGFQNVLAVQPGGTGLTVCGADVSGFHRSADYGGAWRTTNTGLTADLQARVASVAFSNDPATPNTVYAATGNKGENGGFFVSTNGGQTWTRRSSVPQFSGNNNGDVGIVPDKHPRSTGNLVALDEAGSTKYLYVATFKDGVMRSTDGGATWTPIGLSGQYLRSLLIDPARPWVVYAAAYDNHVWKTNYARRANETADWTQLASSPERTEEIILIGSTLYAAGTDTTSGVGSGVFKSSDDGVSWTKLGGDDLATSSTWMSLTGYSSGGAHVLYAGCDRPRQIGTTGWHESAMKSTDGGATWTNAAPGAAVRFTVGGPTGPRWWLTDEVPAYTLGKSGYTAAQIVVDPANSQRVFIVGRSGVWRTANGGADWYPVVNGMAVTVNRAVAADPTNGARVYVGNTDYRVFYSNDRMGGVTISRPSGSPTSTKDLYVDPDNGRVYVAMGHRDNNTGGEVYSNPNPAAPGGEAGWVDEGLSAAAGGNRPAAVVAGRDGGGARVILAAVEQGADGDGGVAGKGGIYRKVGTGSWTLVNSTAMGIPLSRGGTASFSWVSGSPYVYLYDYQTGVWRSNNHGAAGSWAKIWNKQSLDHRTGYVVADPAQVGRIYVSALDGVYRLTNAHTGTVEGGGITRVALAGPANPGSIALGPTGKLYAVDSVTATRDAAIYEWASPAASTASVNIADAYYRGIALAPSRISVANDGRLYIALSQNGVIVGIP